MALETGLTHFTVSMPSPKIVTATEVQSICDSFPTFGLLGYTKEPAWALLASSGAIRQCDEIQLWRIHLLLDDLGTSFLSPPIAPQSTLLCRAITMQMQVALDDKNLGRWAELMQIRTRYLPFERHLPWQWLAVSATSTTGGWQLPLLSMSYTWFTTSGSRLYTLV